MVKMLCFPEIDAERGGYVNRKEFTQKRKPFYFALTPEGKIFPL